MKKIVANAPLQQQLYHRYFKEKNGLVSGVQIAPLSSYLNQDFQDSIVFMWSIQAELRKADFSLFPSYADMLQYPSFVQEVIHFAKDCIAFGIQKKDLPENDKLEKELKELIGLVLQSSVLDAYRNAIEQNKQLDLSSLEVKDIVLEDDYHSHLLKGKLPSRSFFQETISDLRTALNIRQEMEVMAQEICSFKGSVNIVLSQYSSQFPILKQVFHRYGIPFSAYQQEQPSLVGRLFKDLFLVAYQQDVKAFLDLIENNAFHHSLSKDEQNVLSKYLSKVEPESPKLPLQSMEELWSDEAKAYARYQERINAFYLAIQENLSTLLQAGTIVDKLKQSYDVFITLPFLKNLQEQKLASSLESFLNQIGDQVDEDNLPFFLELLDHFKSFCLPSEIGPIMVTDLRHPVLQAELSYIIGLNSDAYPNIPNKSGIFNEDYYAQLSYPSYEERYETYLSQLSWIFHSGKQIHFSYSQKDYEGKKLEASYAIQSLFTKKSQIIKAKELLPRKTNQHEENLSPSFMQEWFTQNPVVKGSVSSIEEWYRCPYQYFLSRLLKIQEQSSFEPNSLYLGIITHAILEKAFKQKGSHYYELSLEDIQHQLTPYFELWKELDKSHVEDIDLMENKLASNIHFSLQYLKGYEEKHDFIKPIASEQEFHINLFDGLELIGKIDRIDQDQRNQDYYLYDYKSSEHRIDKYKYLSGQQIQLMTYKLVLEKDGDKKVRATYYFSLSPQKQKLDYLQYKFNRRSVEKEAEDVYKDDFLRPTFLHNQSLSGWKLDDDFSDYNKNTLNSKSFKITNDDFNEVTLRLLMNFYEQLKKGTIERKPQDCTFCSYKRICSYRNGATETHIPDSVSELLEKQQEDKQ
ncbi:MULTISPECIES: PD-(D/E)XK nuclease family protein [Terrabacteria group]|uniref:PD-(D/E)XK nuclease family protein n=1 Tax=Bacillati TaxID=1783272 RepID=UPI001C6EBA2A|nr:MULTISPECIES: PD-(D/E)XK nuclease family protein [Terrabacteria group]MBW9212541.1 PD-(D/E)XK nuclease family protein [Trueperella sp. zg.1013]